LVEAATASPAGAFTLISPNFAAVVIL